MAKHQNNEQGSEKRHKMWVYISGKITGDPDYMEHFKKAQEELENRGFTTVNPAALNIGLPEGTTYREYMHCALGLLELCEGIYMLDNWKNSPGAIAEYYYASALKMITLHEHM